MTGPSVTDRSTYFGGSDAATILGISPYSTRMRLFAERRGLEINDPPDPAREQFYYFGHLMEPVIALAAGDKYKLRVDLAEPNLFHRSTAYPIMAGHSDYPIILQSGKRTFLECKNVRFPDESWGKECDDPINDPASDRVPNYYYVQCLHYMIVQDVSYCYLAALFGGNELRLYRIERNDEDCPKLIRAEHDFWQMIEKDEPPFATDSDDYLLLLQIRPPNPDAATRIVELTDEQVANFQSLVASRELASGSKTTAEDLREDFILLAAGWPAKFVDKDGKVLGSVTIGKRSGFDEAKFAKEEPAAYEAYKRYEGARESKFFVIRPVKEKRPRTPKAREKKPWVLAATEVESEG